MSPMVAVRKRQAASILPWQVGAYIPLVIRPPRLSTAIYSGWSASTIDTGLDVIRERFTTNPKCASTDEVKVRRRFRNRTITKSTGKLHQTPVFGLYSNGCSLGSRCEQASHQFRFIDLTATSISSHSIFVPTCRNSQWHVYCVGRAYAVTGELK